MLLILPFAVSAQTSKKQRKALIAEASNYEKLADYNIDTVNYPEAVRLGTLASDLYKQGAGEKSPLYAKSIGKLAEYHYYNGNYSEALRVGEYAAQLCKTVYGAEHEEYLSAMENCALFLCELGKFISAADIQAYTLEVRQRLNYRGDNYVMALGNLASYYFALGNHADAIKLVTSAIEAAKNILGDDHPYYFYYLENLAYYNLYSGNYTEAIRLEKFALESIGKVLGETHPDYALSLHNLAGYYYTIGNYREAVKLETRATQLRKTILGEQHPHYAISLKTLAGFKCVLGDTAEAIQLGLKALQIFENNFGDNHPDYSGALINLSTYYAQAGNYKYAIRLATRASSIEKNIYGEQHANYAAVLGNLAEYNYKLSLYPKAIDLEQKSLQIRKNVWGENHPDYAVSLSKLAQINLYAGNYAKSAEYYSEAYDRIKAFILKNFLLMTYKERTDFWNKYAEFFVLDLPYAVYKLSPLADSLSIGGSAAVLAYNSQVFSKGLLLNTELEIQKILQQSSDSTLLRRYYKIRQNRGLLDNLLKTNIHERTMNADSLANAIEAEERALVLSSSNLGNYTRNLSIDYKEIQKHLKDNDIAIEFAECKDANKERIFMAFVLKKGMDTPKVVTLFKQSDMWNIKKSEYYTTSKLYNLVWKPLEKYLQGVTNVYFSPAGRFHNIAIEYLPTEKGTIFAEQYDAYRLSSTREIAMEQQINPDRKAATYGGIEYDFSNEDWLNLIDSRDTLRGAVAGFLRGSKIESETIAKYLRNANYIVSEQSGRTATEDSFKKLSGSRLKILHIGTHGFYKSDFVADLMPSSLMATQSSEDRSLTYSGLLFAGANTALDPLKNSIIPEGFDDGILTAREISRLDFRGLDLVVLSACKSGLGEITGEGVFGLQRGFKKAGAQTIVMSLWDVSDSATQLLMTEFFKNLTAGQSKRAAFVSAQTITRQQYPDPQNWAAFVMVDGLW